MFDNTIISDLETFREGEIELKKLKKLKRFTVTVKINVKQSRVEINHIVKINEK